MPDDRDEHGRFKPGNKPVNGLDKRPEDRHKLPTKGRQFQLAATKFLGYTNAQMLEELDSADDLTQAELLAIEAIARAKGGDLAALAFVIDRAEGRPAVAEKPETPYEPPVYVFQFPDMSEEDVNDAIRWGGNGKGLQDGDGERDDGDSPIVS